MTKEDEKKKRADYKAKKVQALNLVLATIKENFKDPELLQAVVLLTPGNRAPRSGAKETVMGMFVNSQAIHEDEVWSQYKLGRVEMRRATIELIKKTAPDARMWISFNADEGVYTLVGKGADVPEGWTGYKPIVIEDMDIE